MSATISIPPVIIDGVVSLASVFIMALCRAGISYMSEKASHSKLVGQRLIEDQFFAQLTSLAETAVQHAEQVATQRIKNPEATNMTSAEKKAASLAFVMSNLDTSQVPERLRGTLSNVVADHVEAAVFKCITRACK